MGELTYSETMTRVARHTSSKTLQLRAAAAAGRGLVVAGQQSAVAAFNDLSTLILAVSGQQAGGRSGITPEEFGVFLANHAIANAEGEE